MARTKHPQAVWLRWLDAHFDAADDGAEGIVTDSLGWLVSDTPRSVKIAQSIYPNGELTAKEVLTVPRGMVLALRPAAGFRRPPKPDNKPP